MNTDIRELVSLSSRILGELTRATSSGACFSP
ncbi:hypothetical protein AHiyo8_02600 [Arthrobacter sp. Hiyo8]|nr:hypothetical protein AHiyo8_02600 [Arthrobacter sp. Hiyo8]